MKRYEGCLAEWKIKLAVARMRALGLPQDQWPDALQRLALAMTRFQHDGVNGAKESTALCTLINNQVASMLRRDGRERDRLARYRASLPREHVYEPQTELRLDVRLALGGLSAPQRRVCAGLMCGDSIARIARDMRCTWHAVKRIIDQVRAHFERIGLDGWVRG